MTYSRRQLEAFGEPFGDSATCLKPGGRIYGGGGSKTPANTTQTSTNELPEWARGYAKDTLAKTAALSDPNQNPYKQYGGERIAGFQPLQTQAMNTIGGLDAGPEAFQKQVGGYMSPYMQNVVDIQKREAGRQSGILGQQIAAKAVQSGAFGGSRQALQTAERDRNLAEQMNDIQARGSQAAYDSASNQFRQGITQQSGLAQMQSQLGALQQQQAQRPLDMAYQDFINQQNQPYKQLGFMSDMIRGLPLGQQSTSSIYQAGPSGLQTLGALGMGAYGLNQMFGSPYEQKRAADGGLMESYADGGEIKTYAGNQGSVTSEYNIADIINKLNPEQLQQAKEAALNRRDVQTVEMIDQRLAELAQTKSLTAGLGSAFDNLPTEQQENVMSAANGGIVAFADEGLVEGDDAVEVDPETQKQALGKIQGIQYTQMTPQQRRNIISANRRSLEEDAGPSPYADYKKQIDDMAAEDTKGLAQAKGMAAFAAIPAILEGNNAIRGAGAGIGAFSGAYGQALQANKAQKRSLMNMRMNLADAERKERMGLNREALALGQQASKDHHNAQIFGLEKAKAMALIAARTKPTAAKAPNADSNSLANYEQAYIQKIKPLKGETEEQRIVRAKELATDKFLNAKGQRQIQSSGYNVSDFTGNKADVEAAKVTEARQRDAASTWAKLETSSIPAKKKMVADLVAEHGSLAAAKDAYIANYMRDPGTAPAAKKAAPAVQSAPVPKPTAVTAPTLNDFLAKARKANPGTSDADLTAYYNKKYGKQ